MHTFYLEPENWHTLTLTGNEFHHLSKVLRLKAGEEISLLDGKGKEAICQIAGIDKKEAKLTLLAEKMYPEEQSRITLALGWGKAASKHVQRERDKLLP